MIDTLNSTSGTSAKVKVLREYNHLLPLIRRIWGADRTYVTLSSIDRFVDKPELAEQYTLYQLFDALAARTLSGHRAKASIRAYIRRYPQYEDVIKKILVKNLRVRLGEKLVLSAFPGALRVFEVALAQDFDGARFLTKLEEHRAVVPPAFVSRKIDGVRVVAQAASDGSVAFYSRTGQRFTSIDSLAPTVARLAAGATLTFDGEVIAVDSKGAESFRLTVSGIRQNRPMPAPVYHVFDAMPTPVFMGAERSAVFGERHRALVTMFTRAASTNADTRDAKGSAGAAAGAATSTGDVRLLEQYPYSAEQFEALKARARESGWEGLIIRFNHVYESGRSYNMMKYKFFETEEFKVVDAVIEIMPFPNDKGGEDFVRALNSIVVHYRGNPVHVGSGFTKDERLRYAAHPEEIVGKTVSVRYQEPLHDEQTGRWSLRMPTLVAVLGAARDF